MNYFARRSLYYYFLMSEVAGGDKVSAWRFVAGKFGLKEDDAERLAKILENGTLNKLSSCYDIFTYKNFLGKYCKDEGEFGKSEEEAGVLDCKFEALEKLSKLFDKTPVNGKMLGSLAHKYEANHTAAVLYALCLLYLNGDEETAGFAREILLNELRNGKNSAAGMVLLNVDGVDKGEVMGYLSEMPDMRVLPDVLGALTKIHGGGEKTVKKRVIGF